MTLLDSIRDVCRTRRDAGLHTPGPWRVYQGFVHPNFSGPSPSTTNGDYAICEPLGPNKDANARLIAAAPELLAENERLKAKLDGLRKLCAEQAEDDGLWFVAERISEAYLQQELRKLHAAVESEP